MLVEFIEYYPVSEDQLTGTLKVRLPEFKIQLLGIFAQKREGGWFISLPCGKGADHKSGRLIRFPYVAFDDPDTLLELIESIKQKGPEFIEKRIADTNNPLAVAVERKVQPVKPPAPATKSKFIDREYKDLPPRKSTFKKRYG